MEKKLFRVTEAAEFLRVSRWTIYRWVAEGRLKGTKLGRSSLRIFGESVMMLVEQHRTDDGAPDSLGLPPGCGIAARSGKVPSAPDAVRVATGGRHR